MKFSDKNALQSMTGYGRAARRSAAISVTIELRSTNHRYLEIDQRLPNGLVALEGRLAQLIRGQIRRGRVEAALMVQSDRFDQRKISFDERLLHRYYNALVDIKNRFGLKGHITLEHLLAMPQAVTVCGERFPLDQMWEPIKRVAEDAICELVRTRLREGAKLAADLRTQLGSIERSMHALKKRLPKALVQQRRRLRVRLQELLGAKKPDSTSVLEEAVALVKDVDINEEMVRLASHIAHAREALEGNKPVGKQLDFIAQELMREANTMGAKVNDSQASKYVFDIKGSIEKIREQAQNLE